MIPDDLVDEGLNALIEYLAARTELIAAEAEAHQYGSYTIAVHAQEQAVANARARVQGVLRRITEPS